MTLDFKSKQSEFSSYIRDPVKNPKPADVKPERMETYRELFFNNIDGFLSNNFPVLKTLLSGEQWFELTQSFFSKHPCTTPYFSEIPEEFLNYLQEQSTEITGFPFLLELAHYEWVEMAVSISTEELLINIEENINNLGNQNISLSALAWPLVYQFPVHQISPDFLPQSAPKIPTYLLVYRDQHDEVHFLQITPLTFRLLQVLQDSDNFIACNDLLTQIAQESGHSNPESIKQSGLEILMDLAIKNIIYIENKTSN